ncbi:bifunctional diguanylate cyclase/phosphodiesterase [Thermovibrio ammonificans]|jgi:diguanylate cyclase (GGDEF)-like protein|uniref:Diguanylate cyclase/phosphodiesterase n=1 Tax=Thermovibrio ammonificans (strain DSM 15698 / JCM 12110 / HB-1) TaxID=648996 RepID=E8T276_THEA1|nr:bifunctional diguanylate cyclase/phosphodiesterase [Thermovibrio ammonificans]ADU96971.1 diguanylate cyclase/phosphodiesterase [Thermovibrio ammonificans HB-1]
MVDEVTGLPSRKSFFNKLRSVEPGTPVIIAIFDIDDFKFVNFSHGYQLGDAVLKATGHHLKRVFKKYFSHFFVARTGANQFSVLLFDKVPIIRIKEVFNRHIHLIEFKLKDEFIRVTVSGGVSSGQEQYFEVFSQAEDALYTAKREGKNELVFYQHFSLQDAKKFREIRQKLIEAIRNKAVFPCFQPIVSLRTGEIFGYEVLSRIKYRDEILKGDYVFSVADSLALTPEIDKLLFINTIKFFGPYKLFFNLSMKYFFRELNTIFQIAKQYNLDLSNVIFEITESQKLMSEKAAISIFTLFKEFNAGIAIDDFGAGYSNFMYLKKFPADVIKIDGSFIRGAKEDRKDLTIVKSIVEVGKAFKLRTLAEFIEDEETYRLMKAIGVSLGQGYFIGKPAPEPVEVRVELSP